MNFAFPKNFSRSFARMLTLSILMLALTSQAQETLHESVQVGHETTALVYSENGSEEIFRVEMKNSEQGVLLLFFFYFVRLSHTNYYLLYIC